MVSLVSCHDREDEMKFACGEEVSLSNEVMPIIDANCAISLCHADGVQPFLNTAEQIILKSERIGVRVENGSMPPGGQPPLSSEDVDLILCWIADGSPDN